MPRQPRGHLHEGVFHVTARGNRRQPIFADELDREVFLGLFADVSERFSLSCHAYCLMDNHYHLVVDLRNSSLPAALQRLNGIYAQQFNRRHGFDGHLFQGRYHAVSVESDWQLLALARYVVVNPVHAGICNLPADWPWSSYRGTAGLTALQRPLVDSLLDYFSPSRERARDAYRSFVAESYAAASGRDG